MFAGSIADRLVAVTIVVLLLLTALGDATALLLMGVLGLLIGALLLPKHMSHGEALAAAVSFAVAIVIALIMLIR